VRFEVESLGAARARVVEKSVFLVPR
jgi:hypothetical protein